MKLAITATIATIMRATHDESLTDVFDAAPVSMNKRSGIEVGKKRVNTSVLDKDDSVVEVSKVRENVPPPVNCAQLYMN